MTQYLNLKCPKCSYNAPYYPIHVQVENNGPEDPPTYWVDCHKCKESFSNWHELKEIIKDYEPDPDTEYDRSQEDKEMP